WPSHSSSSTFSLHDALPIFEEDGAAVGELEHAGALPDRARERAPLVTEHLGLEQLGGDGAAVDRYEGAIGARARGVDGARDQLLAGAALAHDEDGGVGHRHLPDQQPDLLDERVLAD